MCSQVVCTTMKCKCQGNLYVVQWWNKKQDNFNTKLNDIFPWDKSMIYQWAMDPNKETYIPRKHANKITDQRINKGKIKGSQIAIKML